MNLNKERQAFKEQLEEIALKYRIKLSEIDSQTINNALDVLENRKITKSDKNIISKENLNPCTQKLFELMEEYRQEIKQIFIKNNQKLTHITSISPEDMTNGKIAKSFNRANNYETEYGNWVFASSQPVDGSNAYIARKPNSGMIYLGHNIYIYGGDNIEVKNGRIFLKEPNYIYEIKPDKFLPVVTLKKDRENSPYFEFSEEWISEEEISIKETEVKKVKDITAILNNYQVLCDVKNKRIGVYILSILKEGNKEKITNILNIIKEGISNKTIRYINAEVGINTVINFEKLDGLSLIKTQNCEIEGTKNKQSLKQKIAHFLQKNKLLMHFSFVDKFVHQQLDVLSKSQNKTSRDSKKSKKQQFIESLRYPVSKLIHKSIPEKTGQKEIKQENQQK